MKLIRRCWSFVGKFGGAQILSLEPPDEKGPNCLENEGKAIHELMHALGIFHEHSRADRDMYIDIHYENIIPGKLTFRNYAIAIQIRIIILRTKIKLHLIIYFITLCENNICISLSIFRIRISIKLQQAIAGERDVQLRVWIRQYNALRKPLLQRGSYKTDSDAENTRHRDRPTKSDE